MLAGVREGEIALPRLGSGDVRRAEELLEGSIKPIVFQKWSPFPDLHADLQALGLESRDTVVHGLDTMDAGTARWLLGNSYSSFADCLANSPVGKDLMNKTDVQHALQIEEHWATSPKPYTDTFHEALKRIDEVGAAGLAGVLSRNYEAAVGYEARALLLGQEHNMTAFSLGRIFGRMQGGQIPVAFIDYNVHVISATRGA